jgi:P pilus assembly chaperone PapD
MEQTMTRKSHLLTVAILALTAVSGPAFAGVTISDQRYWPDEAHAAVASDVTQPENAYASATTAPPVEHASRYEGGPKADD